MSNTTGNNPNDSSTRHRRSSVTQQTLSSVFGRSNSTSGAPVPPFPGPISTAVGQEQRRRMSISSLGLSGTSPSQTSPFPFGNRRTSVSERSDSIDESAIDDDDVPGRSAPTTPFVRRMSLGAQALRARGSNVSPGNTGRAPTSSSPKNEWPPTIRESGGENTSSYQAQASTQSKPRTTSDFPLSARAGESGFNLGEQLRSRAESAVSQSQRPVFPSQRPARTQSISEMPGPPAAGAPPARSLRDVPDAMQERILKGDFYMD